MSARGAAHKPSHREKVVELLRGLSVHVSRLGDKVYFPPREPGERQPVTLENYVDARELGGLLHYLADMLEE